MNRDELLFRAGFYFGAASRLLGDTSYEQRFRGHAEDLTAEAYCQYVSEIHARLVAAGHCRADEDLYESEISK